MGTNPPPLNTNNIMTFTCQGSGTTISGTTLLFHQFDPPTLALQNAQMNTWTATGGLQNNAGGANNPLQSEWGMTRVCDTTGELFAWFLATQQSGVAANQADCTVTIMGPPPSAGGTPATLGTWNLKGSYPIAYSQSGMDANSNAALTESIRFHSTDCEYKAGG
jgi:hypothetical protein